MNRKRSSIGTGAKRRIHGSERERGRIHRRRRRSLAVRLLVAAAILFTCAGAAGAVFALSGFGRRARIQISASDREVYVGEGQPPLLAEVTSDTERYNKRIRLDKKKKLTAEKLVRRLEKGEGISLVCDADLSMEGTYPVRIELDRELKEKLGKDWRKKVQLQVREGTLTVKNPVGRWKGGRFQRYDGSWVTDGFVTWQKKSYYFDSAGEKAVGWREIDGAMYYFDDSGAMEAGQWKDGEDGRYYLGADGRALTGWQEIEGSRYYFDQKGKMAVGDVYMGLSLYSVGGDGKFLSVKESRVDPSRPMVALTFDDGPGKRTGEILDQLKKYGAHATFFMLGEKVSSYPELVKRMKDTGCELGNHSYDHADLTKLDAGAVSSQVQRTNDRIREAAGTSATVMRPPYGAINSTVSGNVGMPMILWNIDTLDWKTRDAKKTVDTVMSSVDDGDIILMHDIHTESVDAALELIPKLQEAGYQLVTVSELAAAKSAALVNGKSYTDF